MDRTKIFQAVDHTLLAQTATWEEIRQICDDALACHTASVCIPPSYVKRATEYLAGRMAVCTVIGFPNGYQTTAVKCFETKDALDNGADEIDMVINIGDLKDKNYAAIEDEIRKLKEICGQKILKVIDHSAGSPALGNCQSPGGEKGPAISILSAGRSKPRLSSGHVKLQEAGIFQ